MHNIRIEGFEFFWKELGSIPSEGIACAMPEASWGCELEEGLYSEQTASRTPIL